MPSPQKILYLLRYFPRESSQTFIISEIVQLQKIGFDIHVAAFYKEKSNTDILFSSKILKKTKYAYRKRTLYNWLINILHSLFALPLFNLKKTEKIFKLARKIDLPIKNILHALRLFSIFKKEKISLIHVAVADKTFLDIAFILSKIWEVPFTITYRAMDIYSFNFSNKEIIRKSIISNNASQIITISQENAKKLRMLFPHQANINLIHSAIDINKFKRSSQRIHLKKEPVKIISICRFVEKKGIEYLLEALSLVTEQGYSFFFTLIGSGEKEGRYRDLIDQYHLHKHISIQQPIDQNSIRDLLTRHHIFCLPCVIAQDGDRDILPNVLKEAMAMELPVITSNISGIEELISHKSNGYLIPPRNSRELANAIIMLWQHPELRTQLGKNARQTIVNHFNIAIESTKIARVFEKAMY